MEFEGGISTSWLDVFGEWILSGKDASSESIMSNICISMSNLNVDLISFSVIGLWCF